MVLKTQFFFLLNHFSPTWKYVNLWYKTTFFSGQPFFSNHISWTRFLKPLFYTFLEKWLQNKWSNEVLLFFDSTTFSRLGHKLRKKMFVFLRNWRQEQILQRFSLPLLPVVFLAFSMVQFLQFRDFKVKNSWFLHLPFCQRFNFREKIQFVWNIFT